MAKTVHEEEYRLIDRVSAGFQVIANGVKGLSTRFTELNQAAELAGKGINLAVRAAEGIGDAVSSAGDYEEAMRRVSIITNATADEQVALQQAVRDAADTVGATAEESAAALLNMARDGFSARDAIDSLGAVLAYARAQAIGAKEAAAGLGGILDSFGERSVTSVAQVADALTAAAQAAGTTTDTLEKGLGSIGLAAQQANLSFEQTVALLATLAKRNIEGADASKRMATILEQFQDPASKAGEALAKLGLSGADFTTVLARLSSDGTAATAVLETLGRKPREALLALLEQGGGALKAMSAIIDANAGASQRAADALKGTFNDAVKRVTAQLSILQSVAAGPILTPLADGLQVLSDRLSEFAASPEFALLTEQLTRLVTESASRIADFITTLNFEEATKNIAEFATVFADNFNKVAQIASFVGGIIGTMYDTVKAGAAGLVEAFTGVAADIAGVVGLVSDDAAEVSRAFRDMSTGARKLSDEALADLARRFGLTSTQAASLAREMKGAALAARVAAGDFEALKNALPKSSLDATIERLQKFGLTLKSDVPEAAAAGTEGLDGLGASATRVAADFERMQIGTFIKAMDRLRMAGLESSDTYKALSAQLGDAEERLRKLTQETNNTSDSNENLANSANDAARALMNQANAADAAGSSGERLSEGNSQVAESFGNIGQASADAAIGLGTMTQAYLEQITAAAGNAKSARDYIRTFNDGIAAFADEEKRIKDRIAILDRQNASLREEERIRAAIENRYGNSSTLIDVLIAKERALHEEKKKTNDEAQRGLDIEKERAGVAGAFGVGRANQDAGPVAAGGKGTGSGTGRDGVQVVQNVTINGLPTDRNSVRNWVSDVLLPELARIDRLRR